MSNIDENYKSESRELRQPIVADTIVPAPKKAPEPNAPATWSDLLKQSSFTTEDELKQCWHDLLGGNPQNGCYYSKTDQVYRDCLLSGSCS